MMMVMVYADDHGPRGNSNNNENTPQAGLVQLEPLFSSLSLSISHTLLSLLLLYLFSRILITKSTQFIKEVTIKTYVLHKNPDGPFHGSC